tara:strand:+ start:371 stop:874 length:504 start_codon:yes stop_codon:yes gene_type:complete
MGLMFIENPVSASTLARHLNNGISPEGDNHYVVFLREPVARFWSGVKKDYPDGTYQEKIESALKNLGHGHLCNQVDSVANKEVDEVIVMDDSFQDSVASLLERHDVTWVINFSVDYNYAKNASRDMSQDAEALSYITNTPVIFDKIEKYYADDFVWWEDFNSKVKGV